MDASCLTEAKGDAINMLLVFACCDVKMSMITLHFELMSCDYILNVYYFVVLYCRNASNSCQAVT